MPPLDLEKIPKKYSNLSEPEEEVGVKKELEEEPKIIPQPEVVQISIIDEGEEQEGIFVEEEKQSQVAQSQLTEEDKMKLSYQEKLDKESTEDKELIAGLQMLSEMGYFNF